MARVPYFITDSDLRRWTHPTHCQLPRKPPEAWRRHAESGVGARRTWCGNTLIRPRVTRKTHPSHTSKHMDVPPLTCRGGGDFGKSPHVCCVWMHAILSRPLEVRPGAGPVVEWCNVPWGRVRLHAYVRGGSSSAQLCVAQSIGTRLELNPYNDKLPKTRRVLILIADGLGLLASLPWRYELGHRANDASKVCV